MAEAIELPPIQRNGTSSEIDNDSYLPDDEKEDYLPLVGDNGQPNTKNYEQDVVDSTPNKIFSLLSQYKQKILIAACVLFVFIGATSLMPIRSSESPVGPSKPGNKFKKNIKFTRLHDMITNFEAAREQYIEKLKIDYGADYYEKMFLDDNKISRGVNMFQQPVDGNSELRFRRKIAMKVIQAFFAEPNDDGANSEGSSGVPFIWVTGGHSAAAGHGNFYDESYGAYMATVIQPILQSIGVSFIGRPYAMGGTSSGAELGICGKEIYGTDMDVITWDFGMTDGDYQERKLLWFYRAVEYSNNVACLLFNGGNAHNPVNQILDKAGATALQAFDQVYLAALSPVPDTFGLTDEEIDKLPWYVRNFKCDNKIEIGDPYCDKMKWNDTMCVDRRHKTNWHPGWKWHAMIAHLMTLYLVDVFGTVLDELAASTTSADDLTTLFQQYEKEASDNFNTFLHQEPPADVLKRFFVNSNNTSDEITSQLVEVLANEPNFCRTGRLPAQARFKGLVTESNQTGLKTYDHGMSDSVAKTTMNTNSEFLRLVYDEEERYDCPADIWLDFKDSFLVHYMDSTRKLIIPNDSEILEYDPTHAYSKHLAGYVAMCGKGCDWGCPKEDLKFDAISSGAVEIKVNGEKVSPNMISFADDCTFVLPESGGLKFKANSDGKFEVTFTVLEEGKYFRISSLVVW